MRSCRGLPARGAQAGLTLAELTIAVVVAGILASVALPSYQRTIERARWQTAGDVLQTIYAGERLYRSQNPDFTPSIPTASWSLIYMDDPNLASPAVNYSVTNSGSSRLTKAERVSSGQYREIDLKTGSTSGSTWPMP